MGKRSPYEYGVTALRVVLVSLEWDQPVRQSFNFLLFPLAQARINLIFPPPGLNEKFLASRRGIKR